MERVRASLGQQVRGQLQGIKRPKEESFEDEGGEGTKVGQLYQISEDGVLSKSEQKDILPFLALHLI